MEDASLSALLAEHAATTHVVGAVVGVLSARETAFGCYGAADLARNLPATPNTRFAVASITKPMVATAIARLVASGSLGLDDPVAKRVPDCRGSDWGERATLRHLLANTSGLTMTVEREWGLDGDDALAHLSAAIASDPPVTEPGAIWSYGNSGWGVLGRVMECVTGEPWEEAMRRLVVAPMGLGDTDFINAGVPRATSYHWLDGGHAVAPEWNVRGSAPGGAGLLSSAGDLLRFARVHLDDGSLAFLRDEHANVGFPWFLDAWCLGLARFDWGGTPAWGWDGIAPGVRAILRILPDKDAAVVLLANTDTGRATYRALFPPLLDQWFGVRFGGHPTEGAAADLHRYAGLYAWPDRALTVSVDGDALLVRDSLAERPTRARPLDDRNFLGDADHPDGDTFSFGSFDAAGCPHMAYHLVWGFPRVPVLA